MTTLYSRCPTLAKIAPQTISEGLKSQTFQGGGGGIPTDPPSLELPMAAYKFSPPKVKLLPTPLIGSLGMVNIQGIFSQKQWTFLFFVIELKVDVYYSLMCSIMERQQHSAVMQHISAGKHEMLKLQNWRQSSLKWYMQHQKAKLDRVVSTACITNRRYCSRHIQNSHEGSLSQYHKIC